MSKSAPIYFDNAATTPIAQEVVKAMQPFWSEIYGNASAKHAFGRAARAAVENARALVADLLGAKVGDVTFTASATEANNVALQGVVRALRADGVTKPLVVTTAVEHSSVLEPLRALAKAGETDVMELPVNADGVLDAQAWQQALAKKPHLISVMMVNNETGVQFDVKALAAQAYAANPDVVFHTDACQAFSTQPLNVAELGVGMLTLNGSKLHGPKGVGVWYMHKSVRWKHVLFGGSQEYGYRPGTENVPAIVGMAKAMQLAEAGRDDVVKHMQELSDLLVAGIKKAVPDAQFNTPLGDTHSPAHINFSVPKTNAEALVVYLDNEGVAVGTGSACTSDNPDGSHVLRAMGKTEAQIDGSIRVSLGTQNTKQEVQNFLEVLPQVVAKVRAIS